MNDVFLSCDWGTSTLRLRLIEAKFNRILGEVIIEEGIAKIFDQWASLPERPDRLRFFQKSLVNSIARLEAQHALSCEGLMLIISGMASSSIGMKALPYATVPIQPSEKALSQHFFPADNTFPHDVLLISGLSTKDDVMRGEETELIGLIQETDKIFEERVYIFPGTHSKHIKVKNNRITDFHTFMTGEMFDVLSSRSTLQASLKKPEGFDKAYHEAFVVGIRVSQEQNFLSGLFKTRTNQLLNKLDPYQNFYYLSGLIIGMELAEAKSYEAMIVCAGPKFAELYRLGTEILGLSAKCQFVPASEVATLVCKGHRKIYENLNLKEHT